MKVKIDGELFTNALRRATLATGAAVNPTHKLVKIEARKSKSKNELDSLVISSIAGVLGLTTSVKAEVIEPGVIATDIRALAGAAGAMPLGAIALSLTKSGEFTRVKLTGSSGRTWTAPTADPATIQPVPEPVNLPWLRLPVDAARTALETVGYPTAQITDGEKSWSGIRLEAEEKKLRAVGVSRYQIACLDRDGIELDYKTGHRAAWSGMLPGSALAQFRDLLKEAEDEKDEDQKHAFVDLFIDNSYLYMVGPLTLVIASLPIGEYPPYDYVLSGFAKEPHAVLSRLPLIESIKACLAMGRSGENKVHTSGAHFELRNDTMFISQHDSEHEFQDSVPTASMQGGLNVKFKVSLALFLDQLKAADSDPELVLAPDGRMILCRTSGGYRSTVTLMDVTNQPGAAGQ